MSDPKDVTEANQAISGEGDGSDAPRPPEDVKPGTGIAGAGAQMAADMPNETEAALDRSLAVQGEDAVVGADEEE